MKATMKKIVRRRRRKRHIRRVVGGTPARPRLTVFRSNKNIYAQIIDDAAGRTLVAASFLEKSISKAVPVGGNRQAAQAVGSALAAKAAKAGIKKVVFDRNGYAFHGRVKELAAAAREGGLEF
ncbi:MAG: 50S ribosomal protein L18 [Phycisphaerae bacterium]|nr:50S ribosomal protein L18 [Phycisphaerae bacterium]